MRMNKYDIGFIALIFGMLSFGTISWLIDEGLTWYILFGVPIGFGWVTMPLFFFSLKWFQDKSFEVREN